MDMDDKGYVIVKNYTKTNIDGVFASGTVHDYRYRQAYYCSRIWLYGCIDIEKWLAERKQ